MKSYNSLVGIYKNLLNKNKMQLSLGLFFFNRHFHFLYTIQSIFLFSSCLWCYIIKMCTWFLFACDEWVKRKEDRDASYEKRKTFNTQWNKFLGNRIEMYFLGKKQKNLRPQKLVINDNAILLQRFNVSKI